MKVISFTASLLALSMAAGTAWASVSQQEAAKLGKQLTYAGAQ